MAYQKTGIPFRKPLKFKTVKELEDAIDAYFRGLYDYKRDMWGNRLIDKQEPTLEDGKPNYILQKREVATVTGLAVALDTTRETLLDYEGGKYDDRDDEGKPLELSDEQQGYNDQVKKYSDTIKRAKQMIYADTEQQLYRPGIATGAIFSLKNNYGWQDKTTTEVTNPEGVNPFTGMKTEELRDLLKGEGGSNEPAA